HALDGVPLAVVDRGPGRQLAVAGRAVEAARRLSGGLILHLELAADGRELALPDEIPVGRRRRARRLEMDGDGEGRGARVQVARGRHRDIRARPVEAERGAQVPRLPE